jgi:hypothetical protein
MNDRRALSERIGAASGLLFVGLTVASFAVIPGSDPPSPEEPSATMARYLSDPDQRSDLSISLALLGVFCFFWFLAYLRGVLQRADGSDSWLASVAYGGGLVFAAMMLVASSFEVAADVLADYGNDPQVAKMFFVLGWDYLYVLAPPLAALVSATAAVILQQSTIPRWLGWISLPFALLLVLPPLAWPAVPLFFVWALVVCLTLLVRSVRLPQHVTPLLEGTPAV